MARDPIQRIRELEAQQISTENELQHFIGENQQLKEEYWELADETYDKDVHLRKLEAWSQAAADLLESISAFLILRRRVRSQKLITLSPEWLGPLH
ncbi:hypothetical protein EV356DRAFT_576129 [Viridothelium virens]|uniref:Uncharacterized protein n=1 Tax=Viridothelium virens TaxID=1048519 RepID=A0A6A6HBM1_VIRVR|nr:hypothetical protein EV356DRAFT_576129 [Viridothelium virens]